MDEGPDTPARSSPSTQVAFDPSATSYDALLEVFWSAHDFSSLYKQGADAGAQYSPRVFYHSEHQRRAAAHHGGVRGATTEQSTPPCAGRTFVEVPAEPPPNKRPLAQDAIVEEPEDPTARITPPLAQACASRERLQRELGDAGPAVMTPVVPAATHFWAAGPEHQKVQASKR